MPVAFLISYDLIEIKNEKYSNRNFIVSLRNGEDFQIFFIWKLFSYQRAKIDSHHKTLGQVLIPGQASDRQVRNIIYHFEKFKPFL